MSRSFHVTIKDFRKLSKKEIDKMAKDPFSLLNQWVLKCRIKRNVIRKRRIQKQIKPEE